MSDDDRQFFTLVFEGDITKFEGNPMRTPTPFGVPVASGIGNAFDVIENIHEIEDAANNLLNVILKNSPERS
jgi:hypothetical protein